MSDNSTTTVDQSQTTQVDLASMSEEDLEKHISSGAGQTEKTVETEPEKEGTANGDGEDKTEKNTAGNDKPAQENLSTSDRGMSQTSQKQGDSLDSELLPEKFKGDPAKFIKSYNELQSKLSKNSQESAQLREYKQKYEEMSKRLEEEKAHQERLATMTDQEKEIETLRKTLVEPLVEPWKKELEALKRDQSMRQMMDAERQRIEKDTVIFQNFLQSNPKAKAVEKQLWLLAEQDGNPPEYIQENLPDEHKGKDWRSIPYTVLYETFYAPYEKAAKESVLAKVEEQQKSQPLSGNKSVQTAKKENDWVNMPLDEMEKLLS